MAGCLGAPQASWVTLRQRAIAAALAAAERLNADEPCRAGRPVAVRNWETRQRMACVRVAEAPPVASAPTHDAACAEGAKSRMEATAQAAATRAADDI